MPETKIRKFEIQTQISIEKPCIIRLDGVGMTKQFKTKDLINEAFDEVVEKTLMGIASYFPSAILAYQFSDEISVLFNLNIKDKIYENRMEKLITIAASKAGAIFTGLMNDGNDYFFDCRLIQPDIEKIYKYFESRQAYAVYRFLEKLRNHYLIKKYSINEIENYGAIVTLLKTLHPPVIYEDYPLKSRNGVLAFKNKDHKWEIEAAQEFLDNNEYLQEKINGLINEF